MTQITDQSTTEKDYTKPHAFELEQGRITKVCKCGAPFGAEIHGLGMASPYGKLLNSCLAKATPDMPLFVLKPTDAFAITVIEYWYLMALVKDVPREKMDDVMELRKSFKAWQEKNPSRVHNPD